MSTSVYRAQLFNLLSYAKIYPHARQLAQCMGAADSRNMRATLKATAAALAPRMDDVAAASSARFATSNRLPHYFDSAVTGVVDTFPVYIRRPKDNFWQGMLYSGKHSNITFSAFCDVRCMRILRILRSFALLLVLAQRPMLSSFKSR